MYSRPIAILVFIFRKSFYLVIHHLTSNQELEMVFSFFLTSSTQH